MPGPGESPVTGPGIKPARVRGNRVRVRVRARMGRVRASRGSRDTVGVHSVNRPAMSAIWTRFRTW